jgi:RNA polymerase sigma factor (TIGR02999 family)
MEPDDGSVVAGQLTCLIGQIDAGDESAKAELCALVYDELRKIGRRVRRRSPGSSLATTEVVHEFLGRVFADDRLGQLKNHRYFYATAADQMRRLLVDHWRRKRTLAKGGNRRREELEPWLDELVDSAASRCGGNLEELDSALMQLKDQRPRQYEIVQLKFFAGLTNEQVAKALNISVDTVKRDWQRARARIGACLAEDS